MSKIIITIQLILLTYILNAQSLQLLYDFPSTSAAVTGNIIQKIGNLVYYNTTNYPSELWRTDGTPSGTIRLGNYAPQSCELNGKLIFMGGSNNEGFELWISDGTPIGTMLIKDINPGIAHSYPSKFTKVGNLVFFYATNNLGTELWASDGTSSGTYLVKDINPGTESSYPFDGSQSAINLNGILYFNASSTSNVNELWRSDGTDIGTYKIKDNNSTTLLRPKYFFKLGNKIIFFAYVNGTGYEPYQSDGTQSGTYILKDINLGINGSIPEENYITYESIGIEYNGNIFFTAKSTSIGFELWKTNGTTNGTVLVSDINTNNTSTNDKIISSYPSNFINANGTIYFNANNGIDGRELWKYDEKNGSSTLKMVKNINPNQNNYYTNSFPVSNYRSFCNTGNSLYFVGDDGVHGRELFKTNGAEENTILAFDILLGTNSSFISSFTELNSELFYLNGKLIFFAKTGSNECDLWALTVDDCTSNSTITQNLTGSNYKFQSINTIEASNIIADSKVNYSSNSSILLQPGFKIDNNSIFKASIQSCDY